MDVNTPAPRPGLLNGGLLAWYFILLWRSLDSVYLEGDTLVTLCVLALFALVLVQVLRGLWRLMAALQAGLPVATGRHLLGLCEATLGLALLRLSVNLRGAEEEIGFLLVGGLIFLLPAYAALRHYALLPRLDRW